MKTIRNYFERIIKKQIEFNYLFPKILRQPADSQLIEQTETILDLKFNAELTELYSIADGTELLIKTPLSEKGFIPTFTFMDLDYAAKIYKIQIQFQEGFEHWETGYKPGKKLFPFLYNGAGDFYWVDLNDNSENYGKVYWTNTLPDCPDYRYSSLTKFFQVICECYETGVIYMDETGRLNCDYLAIAQVSQKLDPMKYWEKYIEISLKQQEYFKKK